MRQNIFCQRSRSLSKKILLAVGYYLGIFEIFRIIFSKKGYVPILLYHCILDSIETKTGRPSFYLLGIGITKSLFEKQIKYISKRYKVISLNEYIERKSNRQGLSGFVVITFDDGFKDSALEILRGYRLPATIFIIGDALKQIYWRHKVCYLLDYAQVKNFILRISPDEEIGISLTNSEQKRRAVSMILNALKNISEDKRENLINEIKRNLMVKRELRLEDIYLNEYDIKGLLKEGIYFGAHSITHRDMSVLGREDLLKEVEGSQDLIRGLTGEEKIPFSIPHGKYNERALEVLKLKKVMCNLTSDDGLNRPGEDIYRLKRIFVNSRTFPEFLYKISGVEMLFQNISKSTRSRMSEFLKTLRSYPVSLIKRLDRLAHYKIGDVIRERTNINTPEYWDKYFSKFDNFERDFPYEFLIEFLPKDSSFTLLDIGCGLGDGCLFLKKHFPLAQIEGADLSPLAIKKAKEKKANINFFLLDLKKENPPNRYDFISLVHALEHFNDPFPELDKCLKYVNKAVLIITPYLKRFDSPRLYSRGEHRYLFNENTFFKYKCTILKITEIIPSTGYRNIIYKIEP